jgi:hypothetical protein
MLSAITSSLLIALVASSQITENDKFCVTSLAFGKTFKSNIDRDAFVNSPGWDQEKTDSPPVSPRKAIRLAEKIRKSVVKAPDDWKWHATTLQLFLTGGHGNHCAWHVTFQAMPVEPEAGLLPHYQEITLIVLMDGTVVKPVVADEKPDEKSQD